MIVTCLDLESVLIPEIWISVADATGEAGFCKTTRDISDYNVLMQERLDLAANVGLALSDLQSIVKRLEPLPESLDFLEWLRTFSQVAIVSDTFYEFVQPIMPKLGSPFLFCHHVDIDTDGTLTGYRLRQADSKKQVIESFSRMGFTTIAIGDSYNDVAMLKEANLGILFNAPPIMAEKFGGLNSASTFGELKELIGMFRTSPKTV